MCFSSKVCVHYTIKDLLSLFIYPQGAQNNEYLHNSWTTEQTPSDKQDCVKEKKL